MGSHLGGEEEGEDVVVLVELVDEPHPSADICAAIHPTVREALEAEIRLDDVQHLLGLRKDENPVALLRPQIQHPLQHQHLAAPESGNIQGTFREHSGNIQGTFREHSEHFQGTWEHSGNIQGTFREHSGNIQGTFREHSGNIQSTFREHGNIQGTFRALSGNIQGTW
jgi:hypothetical protein